jgi:tRNA-2-methylthio-N6-dimethylallyladenosine synthase
MARTPIWWCSTPATSAKRRRRRSIPTSAAWSREDGSAPLIAVAGCVAQAEGEEIMARAPAVKHGGRPAGLSPLARNDRARAKAVAASTDTDMPAETKFDALPAAPQGQGPSAFLTVQEGCDKFCTYCVVPYTRGAEISRPFSDLVDEARRLVEAGAREITLLGQNVNAWTAKMTSNAHRP